MAKINSNAFRPDTEQRAFRFARRMASCAPIAVAVTIAMACAAIGMTTPGCSLPTTTSSTPTANQDVPGGGNADGGSDNTGNTGNTGDTGDTGGTDDGTIPNQVTFLAPTQQPSDVANTLATVTVEVADSPTEWAQGLMHRPSLGTHDGMLFIFPNEQQRTFWMQNTLIPLDMIFLDAQRVVVGIVANAEPLTLEQRGVDDPSQYVVEVNGGYAAEHGITPGSTATFEHVP